MPIHDRAAREAGSRCLLLRTLWLEFQGHVVRFPVNQRVQINLGLGNGLGLSYS